MNSVKLSKTILAADCRQQVSRVKMQFLNTDLSLSFTFLKVLHDISSLIRPHFQSFRRFRASLASARHHLIIWQDTLKEIGSRFGTSVLSYFLFLKWLLKFNLFSLIINFCFITIPQIVHEPNISSTTGFRGLELLTGVVSPNLPINTLQKFSFVHISECISMH